MEENMKKMWTNGRKQKKMVDRKMIDETKA